MEKLDSLNQVSEFHRTFQHPIKDQPGFPDAKRCRLRVSLIAEELKELRDAIEDRDLVEVADALCDIQYVLSGAVLEFGMGDIFTSLFNEVQRSNMSKSCNTKQEALDTCDYYRNEKDTPCYYREVDGKYLVYRESDQKTLKSIYYSPANLKGILDQYQDAEVG